MERYVNKLILVGTIGRDPEVHELKDGQKIAHSSLATTRPHSPEEEARTDWHRLTMRGKLADFADEYIRCGARVYIEGAVHYDSYLSHDGITIPSTDVEVREVVILTGQGSERLASSSVQ